MNSLELHYLIVVMLFKSYFMYPEPPGLVDIEALYITACLCIPAHFWVECVCVRVLLNASVLFCPMMPHKFSTV